MKRLLLHTGSETIKYRVKAGFTIIELMVATLVFSVVLLVIAVGVTQFNHAYYAGITQSNTQNTARTILENISQAIQFSGGTVTTTTGYSNPGTSYYFCVDGTRYRYVLGYELSTSPLSGKHQTYHSLVMDTPNGGCNGAGKVGSINKTPVTGNELMSPYMRLSKLSVTSIPGSNLYKIDVRVVYGDDDLLHSPSGGGPMANDVVCQNGAGSQFCAVSELSTVVQKRIN